MPCEGGLRQAKGHTAPAHTTGWLLCRQIPAEGWKGALEGPLTFVTPRSIFIGIRAELAPGALETILAGACPIATEAICALQAKAGLRAVKTTQPVKMSLTLLFYGPTSLNSD